MGQIVTYARVDTSIRRPSPTAGAILDGGYSIEDGLLFKDGKKIGYIKEANWRPSLLTANGQPHEYHVTITYEEIP